MGRSRPKSALPTPVLPIEPLFEGWMPMTQSLMHAQRVQLETLLAWQRSVSALQQDMWDGWVCRWGGGAPIDA